MAAPASGARAAISVINLIQRDRLLMPPPPPRAPLRDSIAEAAARAMKPWAAVTGDEPEDRMERVKLRDRATDAIVSKFVESPEAWTPDEFIARIFQLRDVSKKATERGILTFAKTLTQRADELEAILCATLYKQVAHAAAPEPEGRASTPPPRTFVPIEQTSPTKQNAAEALLGLRLFRPAPAATVVTKRSKAAPAAAPLKGRVSKKARTAKTG